MRSQRIILALIVILCTFITSVSAQTATRTPTPTPSATPRRGAVNRTNVRNVVRGLQLNAASDEMPPACWEPSDQVTAWNVAGSLASGTVTDQFGMNRNDGALMRITEAYFPAICSTTPLTGATAISPTGDSVTPLTWTYDGTPPHYNGFSQPYYVAQLPLSAYRQPGVWRLSVSGPQPFEIGIRVPTANGPFGLIDPFNGGYLVGGFAPGEQVLGMLYNGAIDDVQDTFEFTVNSAGYGFITGYRFQPPGAVYVVGSAGNGLYYPFGTVLFGGERTDIPGIEDGVQPSEMYALLRNAAFGAAPPDVDTNASSAGTCGGYTMRLAVGGQAQRAGTNNVRVRANPSRSAQQVALINNSTPVAVLAGPECVSNTPWWQVNFSGVVGWAAEAADGLILLVPAGNGGAPPANVPTTVVTAPTLVPTMTEIPIIVPTVAGMLDYGQSPNFGSAVLSSGFSPDPYSLGVVSGGSVDASYLGCVGFATSAPDFRLNYSGGNFPLLRFYFIGDGDTTLIINDAGGGWRCNDDSYNTRNPTVDFSSPASGQYDIWVGSYSAGTNISGTLYITELDSNHP